MTTTKHQPNTILYYIFLVSNIPVWHMTITKHQPNTILYNILVFLVWDITIEHMKLQTKSNKNMLIVLFVSASDIRAQFTCITTCKKPMTNVHCNLFYLLIYLGKKVDKGLGNVDACYIIVCIMWCIFKHHQEPPGNVTPLHRIKGQDTLNDAIK